MRRGSTHLVGAWVATAAVVGLLLASGASAAKAPRTVALKVKWTGSGTVHVTGNKAFTCRATVPTGNTCLHTFHVRRGRRIVLKAVPLAGWKMTAWAGACKGSAATCSLKLKARRSVGVTFVPPGDRLNPYPLGTSVLVAEGWRLKVNSAIINADTQVEAVTDQYGDHLNPPPPAGAQYTLVNATMTYVGGGSSGVAAYVLGYAVIKGAGNAGYAPDWQCTPPSPDLGAVGDIYSGQSATGNLCYEIASNDASTLLLSALGTNGQADQTVWFALH